MEDFTVKVQNEMKPGNLSVAKFKSLFIQMFKELAASYKELSGNYNGVKKIELYIRTIKKLKTQFLK